jgi:hypothetical protein
VINVKQSTVQNPFGNENKIEFGIGNDFKINIFNFL